MTVATNEAATCKWGTLPSTTYADLSNTFGTTGGTAHSTTLTALTNGTSYTRYVRCQDAAGNANTTGFAVTFSVAPGDATAPVLSNGQPTGTLPAGTTQTAMTVTTDEAATCRWGTSASTAYASLANAFSSTGGTAHSTTLTGLTNGTSYTRYIRCQDAAGNANTTSLVISFNIAAPADATPPVISNGSPSGQLAAGTTQATMGVATNEAATCKWGTDAGTSFASLANTFATTGGTTHNTSLTGLTNGTSYTRYVRCQDAAGNANPTSFTISFSIAAPPTGTRPVLTRQNSLFLLDGVPISRFGLRAANALQSDAITQRLISQIPTIMDHGMQSVSFTIQGGRNGGDDSGFSGFNSDGTLNAGVKARLASLLDATEARRMVPVVVLFYRARDEELVNAEAVRNAVRETMNFIRPWRHAWVNVINEPGHSEFDHDILTSSAGEIELYRLAKSLDPTRIVFVSDNDDANDGFVSDTWGRNDIDESMPAGSVVIEYERHDEYETPGVFASSDRQLTISRAETAFAIPAYFFYHSAWHQKADASGWPRFDKGGAGTSSDPGVAFIWNRMRELAGPR
jgi:hypothetical protein